MIGSKRVHFSAINCSLRLMSFFATCSVVWKVELLADYSRKWLHLCPYCFSCSHSVEICWCLPFNLAKAPIKNFDCLGLTVQARTVCERFMLAS